MGAGMGERRGDSASIVGGGGRRPCSPSLIHGSAHSTNSSLSIESIHQAIGKGQSEQKLAAQQNADGESRPRRRWLQIYFTLANTEYREDMKRYSINQALLVTYWNKISLQRVITECGIILANDLTGRTIRTQAVAYRGGGYRGITPPIDVWFKK